MNKLKVNDNGNIKKIEFSEKYADGIFLVQENKTAKRNCKELNIEFENTDNPLRVQRRVTVLGKTGILTTNCMNQHFQYIIKDYANEIMINELINDCPSEDVEFIKQVYTLIKVSDINSLSETLNDLGKK